MSLVRNHRSWLRFLPIALWIVAYSAWSDTLSGKVVGVADGDTVTVLDANHQQHKIRLSGIDAPKRLKHLGNDRRNPCRRSFSAKRSMSSGTSAIATAASWAR